MSERGNLWESNIKFTVESAKLEGETDNYMNIQCRDILYVINIKYVQSSYKRNLCSVVAVWLLLISFLYRWKLWWEFIYFTGLVDTQIPPK